MIDHRPRTHRNDSIFPWFPSGPVTPRETRNHRETRFKSKSRSRWEILDDTVQRSTQSKTFPVGTLDVSTAPSIKLFMYPVSSGKRVVFSSREYNAEPLNFRETLKKSVMQGLHNEVAGRSDVKTESNKINNRRGGCFVDCALSAFSLSALVLSRRFQGSPPSSSRQAKKIFLPAFVSPRGNFERRLKELEVLPVPYFTNERLEVVSLWKLKVAGSAVFS